MRFAPCLLRSASLAVACLWLVGGAVDASATDPLSAHLDRRVRVLPTSTDASGKVRYERRVEGRLLDLTPTALQVTVDDTPRWFERGDVHSLEVEDGYGGSALRGMGIGALSGLLVGVFVVATANDSNGGFGPSDRAIAMVFGIPAFTLLGAGIGAGIGSTQRRVQWRPVSVMAMPDGAGLGVGSAVGVGF